MCSNLHCKFDQNLFEHFKHCRNILNRAILKAKEMYYNKKVLANKNEPRKLWDIIYDLLNLKPRKQSVPTELVTRNGDILTNLQDIAQTFNNYFSQIGTLMAKSIKPVDSRDALPAPASVLNSLFLKLATADEISHITDTLKNNEAVHETDIDTKFIKLGKPIISPILSENFDSSINSGCYPDALKQLSSYQFIKKTIHANAPITAQYQYYRSLIKYLKNL